MALFLSVLPIVLLIYLMVKKNALPSYIALPLIAGLVYVLHLTYFEGSFVAVNANFIKAIISVATPITVIFGAVLFNRMMEMTGAMNVLRRWLGNISPNPVAQLMIIGCGYRSTFIGRIRLQAVASCHSRTYYELGTRIVWSSGHPYVVWFWYAYR